MKFPFHSSTIKVRSCRSFASATPLRRECLPMFCFHKRAVDGSVFMMFCNSAQGVMSWQSSASATQLRRECLHKVPQLCCWGECLHEVPLLQLRSNGNVMVMSCHNRAVDGSVFTKFHYSTLGVMSWRVPLPQLRSEGNVTTKSRNSAVMGNVFIKFHFCNSTLGVMSCQSFASVAPSQKEISSWSSATPFLG